MRAILALGCVACGARGAIELDPCEARDPVVVVGPDNDPYRWDRAVLSDGDGYVVFWAEVLSTDRPDVAGIFAARPGEEPVHLIADAGATDLGVVDVADGFLVCWSSDSQDEHGECRLVDHGLAITSDPDLPWTGGVRSLARANDGLYAVVGDHGGEQVLIGIDEDAGLRTPPIPFPCGTWASSHAAWTPDGIACLVPSDPLCGDQFMEPPGCTWGIQVYTLTGVLRLEVPDVAPHAGWGGWSLVSLAARADGYLVSWLDLDAWHAQGVSASGALTARSDNALTHPGYRQVAAHATPSGYLGLWTEALSSDLDSPVVPRFQLLTASGAPAGDPGWLAEADPFTSHAIWDSAAAAAGDGFAVAWEATFGDGGDTFRSGLLFRNFGCPD